MKKIFFVSLVLSLSLLFTSCETLLEAIESSNPQTAEELAFSNVTWIILVISILIKLYMMSYNYSIGKKIDSKALIATGDDSRNDSQCLGSLAGILLVSGKFARNEKITKSY